MKLGFLAALGLLAVAPAWAEPIDVTTSSVALDRRDAARQTLGPLTYLGGLRLRSTSRLFGGLSGLEVSEDGRRLLAISDRGFWFSADLVFGADGRLSGLANTDLSRMRGRDGTPLTRRFLQDAEALARDGEDYLVAFEGAHRIWRYSAARGAMASGVPHAIPGLGGLPSNGGLEALTVLGPGVLLTLSEDGRTPGGDLRGWLIDGERHDGVSFVTQGRFKPTDLAVLPSGDLLVLERSFSGLGGFGARLSVIDRETVIPGARLSGREIARFRAPLVVDNFEGLAVVEVGGRTLLYIVSDDNFSAFQRNLLLMFELDESRLTRQ
ncbi:MAG: esterase-like activity of phytase family protein [Proteobacteria bacterium]|nr:esterase-like activity of phytase family protein [Pseudomonadota bacterium]